MSSLFFLSQFKPFFHSSHPDLTLSKLRPSGIWTIAAFGRTSQPDNGPWARFLDAWMEGGAEVLESNNFDRPYETALTTPRPPTGGSRLPRNGNQKMVFAFAEHRKDNGRRPGCHAPNRWCLRVGWWKKRSSIPTYLFNYLDFQSPSTQNIVFLDQMMRSCLERWQAKNAGSLPTTILVAFYAFTGTLPRSPSFLSA